MSEAKHTPGPWTVCSEPPVLQLGDCTLGQQVWAPTVRVAFTERQNVGLEAEATNAHLIAAAPELRSALEALTNEVMRLTLHTQFGHEGSALLEIISDARAALSKARGEA